MILRLCKCMIVSFGCSPYLGLIWFSLQTEVAGGQNPHGLAAGWAWCARLLNNVPADRITAVALEAFLKV
jgi:nucleoporin GLE1